MITTPAYAAESAKAPLGPFSIERREPGPSEVLIEILYCGVCHSDIHQARGEWGDAIFPMVPGHEIVGRVDALGAGVQGLRIGERVGVPWLGHTCGACPYCIGGHENLCDLVGEIANTFAGNARRDFGHQFQISVPQVVSGQVAPAEFPTGTRPIVIPIDWRTYKARLVVCLG